MSGLSRLRLWLRRDKRPLGASGGGGFKASSEVFLKRPVFAFGYAATRSGH